MKFLSLEYIKAHSRVWTDGGCSEEEMAQCGVASEDELLDLYGTSAEEQVFNLIGQKYEAFIEEHGEVPAALFHAALMLVDVSISHHSPVENLNLSVVPYTFDLMVKPYMKL